MATHSHRFLPSFLLLLLLISSFLIEEVRGLEGEEEERERRRETQEVQEVVEEAAGGASGGGGGRRRSGRRNKEDNDTQRRRNRKKGGGSKRRVREVKEAVREVVEESLRPLHTALSLVRLDTFTQEVHRQLTSLERIQGRLLQEYGEVRAAVGEASRNTLELAKQVAALESRVSSLVGSHPKDTPHPRDNLVSRSADYPQAAMTSDLPPSQVTRAVRETVTAINTRLQATERRFKEDLARLENRTTTALRHSHSALDRRLALAGLDTVLVLNTLDQMANKTCAREAPPSPSPRPHARPRPQRTYMEDGGRQVEGGEEEERSEGAREELAYFPAVEEGLREAEMSTTAHSVLSRATTAGGPRRGEDGPRRGQEEARRVTEVQTLNTRMVSRLASEIVRQITEEGTGPDRPSDCGGVEAAGETTSGVYTIYPASCTSRFSVQVWCEIEEGAGEAWTVVQRRGSRTSDTPHPVVDFFRGWPEYKWGFGNLEGEYWLGLEYIHQLTQSGDYELRVELGDWGNETRWAQYQHFSLSPETLNYTLSLGDYQGTAGNSLKYHQGAAFSTRDRDNDFNPRGHCARTFHGAWWFTACHESHLNGRYHHGRHKSYGDGINWMAFRGHNYSLKYSTMKIRRTNI